MAYRLLIHLESGETITGPILAPNHHKYSCDDIQTKWHGEKYMMSICKQKDVKRCECIEEMYSSLVKRIVC